MTRQAKTILFALLALTLIIPAYAADVPTDFASTHYFILSLGSMAVDLPTLVQTAQAAGHTTIEFEGNVATIRLGGSEASEDLAAALAESQILIVDSGRFYLRQAMESYTYTVRPAGTDYELVVNPQVDVSINETLATILTSLVDINILGNDVNLEYASFAKADLKGPASPAGVPIDSTLYGLVVAEDWFAYSNANALTQTGLRVEVVAEKIPGAALDAQFEEYVLDESSSLAQLLLPIDQLLTLAQSSSIGYVRLAYQPTAP